MGDSAMAITALDLLQIIQTLGIFSGIIAIYLEYRKSNRDRGYETYLRTALMYTELQRWMGEHPEIQEVFEYDQKYKSLSKPEKLRYDYCSNLLLIFEIIYRAHQKGWLERDEWESWEDLIEELGRKSTCFQETWKNEGYLYSKKFREFLDSLMTKQR